MDKLWDSSQLAVSHGTVVNVSLYSAIAPNRQTSARPVTLDREGKTPATRMKGEVRRKNDARWSHMRKPRLTVSKGAVKRAGARAQVAGQVIRTKKGIWRHKVTIIY